MKHLKKIIISELLYLWWLSAGIFIILIPLIIFDHSELMQSHTLFKAKNLSVLLIFIYMIAYNGTYVFEKRKSFFNRIPISPQIINLDKIATSVIYISGVYTILTLASLIDSNFKKWTFYEFLTVQSIMVIIMSFFLLINSKLVNQDKENPEYSNFGGMMLAIVASPVIYGVLFSDSYLFCMVEPAYYHIQSIISAIIALIIISIISIFKK